MQTSLHSSFASLTVPVVRPSHAINMDRTETPWPLRMSNCFTYRPARASFSQNVPNTPPHVPEPASPPMPRPNPDPMPPEVEDPPPDEVPSPIHEPPMMPTPRATLVPARHFLN